MMEQILRILGLAKEPPPAHVKTFQESRKRLAEAENDDAFASMVDGLARRKPKRKLSARASK